MRSEGLDDSTRAALEEALRTIAQAQSVPGLVAAITLDGELAFQLSVGVTDVEAPSPVTLDTRFPLASVTKVATAAAIHSASARGARISSDWSVASLLPDVRWADDRARCITLAQLMSHTAGLDDFDPLAWADAPEDDDDALAREVRRFAGLPLVAEPGSAYRYSNAGYDVAGLGLASAVGTSYERAVRAEVLAPLAMHRSHFHPHPPSGLAAVGHVADGRGGVVPYRGPIGTRAHAPCGTLASCGHDMARLAAALADPERAPVPGLAALMTPVASTGRADGAWVGLGVRGRERHGERVIEHGGWDPGFRCAIAAIPARRAGAFVLTNYHWSWPGMMERLLDAMTGLPVGLGADDIAKLREPAAAGRVTG